MARGWESKAVEAQAQEPRSAAPLRSSKRSVAEIERERNRQGLELSRRRVVRELSSTTSELRRTSLQAALQYLDTELSKLRAQTSQ